MYKLGHRFLIFHLNYAHCALYIFCVNSFWAKLQFGKVLHLHKRATRPGCENAVIFCYFFSFFSFFSILFFSCSCSSFLFSFWLLLLFFFLILVPFFFNCCYLFSSPHFCSNLCTFSDSFYCCCSCF